MIGNSAIGFRNFFIGIALISTLAQPYSSALAGGSDGGTNTDKATKEPVEFKKVGRRVRIDPRTFEGIYPELLTRIRSIEAKIPGLGKELEMVLDQRSWFITDEEFPARTNSEEQPINQDQDHVLLTAHKIQKMSREQLKRSWIHEMVRRIIQDGHPVTTPEQSYNKGEIRPFTPLAQGEIDNLVEKLTVALYQEYDMPAQKLAKYINDILGNTLFESEDIVLSGTRLGYLSRPEIDQRINQFQLKEKYQRACQANHLAIQDFDQTSAEKSASNPNSPFKNQECMMKVFLQKDQNSAEYVQKCIKPKAQKSILASLNALREDGVENEWHNSTEPFRTHNQSTVWSDGYDTYAHPPMNRYGSLGSLLGIGFFEVGISASISGKVSAGTNIEAQTYDDPGRIVGALQSCLILMNYPEALSAITNASQNPDSASIGTEVVTTLEQALSTLHSTETRSPASDPRATSQSSKQQLDSHEPSESSALPNATNATSAR